MEFDNGPEQVREYALWFLQQQSPWPGLEQEKIKCSLKSDHLIRSFFTPPPEQQPKPFVPSTHRPPHHQPYQGGFKLPYGQTEKPYFQDLFRRNQNNQYIGQEKGKGQPVVVGQPYQNGLKGKGGENNGFMIDRKNPKGKGKYTKGYNGFHWKGYGKFPSKGNPGKKGGGKYYYPAELLYTGKGKPVAPPPPLPYTEYTELYAVVDSSCSPPPSPSRSGISGIVEHLDASDCELSREEKIQMGFPGKQSFRAYKRQEILEICNRMKTEDDDEKGNNNDDQGFQKPGTFSEFEVKNTDVSGLFLNQPNPMWAEVVVGHHH